MNHKRRKKQSKKMKPVILIFCEGDTEEVYVNSLRKQYKLPIKVITRITGLSVSPNIIHRYIQAERIGHGDKITSFLMYDLDNEEISKKLSSCKESIIIASNPSVELWFLLHAVMQNAAISTDNCIDKLKKSTPDWTNYRKGSLSEKQKQFLWNNRRLASERAKELKENANPSSSVYRLVDMMDEI